MRDPSLPDDFSFRAFHEHFGDGRDDEPEDEERHSMGCVCADCSGAELIADND